MAQGHPFRDEGPHHHRSPRLRHHRHRDGAAWEEPLPLARRNAKCLKNTILDDLDKQLQ